MIVSFRHNFIFLHARKTAGSSCVAHLSQFLGPKDIILSGVEEILASGQRMPGKMYASAIAGIFAKPSLAGRIITAGSGAMLAEGIKTHYSRHLGFKPQHASARSIAQMFPTLWRQAFKFSVVRNPFDRAVSDYFWSTRKLSRRPSFEEYLEGIRSGVASNSHSGSLLFSNWDKYVIDDEMVLDHYIRYEDLVADFNNCLRVLDLPETDSLPRLKVSSRKSSRDYRHLYDRRCRELVEELYVKEIVSFDYSF